MSRKTRKLIWSAPLVAVIAVVGALALFMTLAPNGAQAHDVPGVPTNLTAEAAPDDPATTEVEGRTQIKLMWQAPSGTAMDITGYRIDRSKDGHVWEELVANSGTPNVLEHVDEVAGSKTGQTYFYRVLAINSSGTSPMSIISDGTTKPLTAPERPATSSATANGPTEIVVKWTSPEDDGGKQVTKYRIHIDPDGEVGFPPLATEDMPGTGDRIVEGDICEFSTNGNGFEYRHKGLLEKEEYRYQIYAMNEIGYSSGAAIRGATTDPKEEPDAPTGLLAVQLSATQTALYWNWPADNGGAEITEFRIEVAERSGDWPESTVDGVEASADAVSNVDLTASTTDTPPVPIDNGVIRLAETTRDGERAYELLHTHGFDPITNAVDDPAVDDDRSDIGQTLHYRVFAVTGTFGQSDELRSRSAGSVRVTLVGDGDDTDLLIDLPPMLVLPTAGAPAAATNPHGNYSEITLDWTVPSDNPTSYRIDYSADGIEWKSLEVDTVLTRAGGYTDDELKPVTTRHYRVFAKRGQQFRPAAKSAAAMTGLAIAPSNVRNLTVTAMGPDTMHVRWDQPEYDGGAPITHYQVQVSDNGTRDWTIAKWISVEKDPTTCTPEPVGEWTHKGLLADTTKYYWVYAINSASTPENVSATILATTPDTGVDPDTDFATTGPASRPGVPTGLAAELAKDSNLKGAGRQGVLVLWNSPPKPPGSPISSYRIERKVMGEDNDEWVELEAASTASQTHYTDRDEPAADEMRYYRVAATNRLTDDAEGLSDWSNVIRMPIADHTHEPVAGPEVGPEVGPATSVTTGPFNAGGVIQVNWDAAPNATGYIIYAVNVDELDDANGQIVVAPVNDAAAETFNLGGLNVGDTYDIYVVATAKEMVAWPASADVKQVPSN